MKKVTAVQGYVKSESESTPRVEVDLTEDTTAATVLIAHRFSARVEADRPREVQRVSEAFRDRLKLFPDLLVHVLQNR